MWWSLMLPFTYKKRNENKLSHRKALTKARRKRMNTKGNQTYCLRFDALENLSENTNKKMELVLPKIHGCSCALIFWIRSQSTILSLARKHYRINKHENAEDELNMYEQRKNGTKNCAKILFSLKIFHLFTGYMSF